MDDAHPLISFIESCMIEYPDNMQNNVSHYENILGKCLIYVVCIIPRCCTRRRIAVQVIIDNTLIMKCGFIHCSESTAAAVHACLIILQHIRVLSVLKAYITQGINHLV